MTFINSFTNLNMDYCGIKDSFTPNFSCWSSPVFGGFGSFMPDFSAIFNNWNFSNPFSSVFSNWSLPSFSNFSCPSLFSSTMASNFSMPFPTNVFDNSIFSAYTFNNNWGKVDDNYSFTNKNKAKFSMKEYNSSAGEKLARYALSHSNGFTGNCARFVKKAIENTGLGRYKSGHAYQMPSILRSNPHFKEVSPSSVNVKDLPAGCVIVFKKGMYNYSDDYGHVEITTGDGRGVSDGITKNLKQPSAIFVPV